MYVELEQGKNAEFWKDMTIITEDEMAKLKKIDPWNARYMSQKEIITFFSFIKIYVTQRKLMRLFEGEIKVDISNSTYCSISKEQFDTKTISYHISIKSYR